jgi:DNA-binding FrmR family transcriptional regulator
MANVLKRLGSVEGQMRGMAEMVDADRISALEPELRAHWWCA